MEKHQGMVMQTKNGNAAHILADPNMSQETKDAIERLIDLAYNQPVCDHTCIMQPFRKDGMKCCKE